MALSKKQKENWILALRSGNYKQGIGKLYCKRLNVYCCIGVFAVCNNIPISDEGEEMFDEHKNHIGYRPLEEQIGIYNTKKLWRMNDSKGKTFSEIADWIEENL